VSVAERSGSRLVAAAGDTGATAPWGLHWLAVSIWGAEPEAVAELVSEAVLGRRLRLSGWQALGGARFYGRRTELIKGVTLLGEPQAPGASERLHLVLPGEACEVAGVDGLLRLLRCLRDLATEVRVVPLDVAVDRARFDPEAALAAVKGGQVVCHAKRCRDGLVAHS
jgi:DNA relaxase NicK